MVVADLPQVLFHRFWLPLPFRPFSLRLRPLSHSESATKKLMKNQTARLLIFATKIRCKSCGQQVEFPRISRECDCGKACGKAVENRWNNSGSAAERSRKSPDAPLSDISVKLLETRILTHNVVLCSLATTRCCGRTLDTPEGEAYVVSHQNNRMK